MRVRMGPRYVILLGVTQALNSNPALVPKLCTLKDGEPWSENISHRSNKTIPLKIASVFFWAHYINHQEKRTCSKLEHPTYLLWKRVS